MECKGGTLKGTLFFSKKKNVFLATPQLFTQILFHFPFQRWDPTYSVLEFSPKLLSENDAGFTTAFSPCILLFSDYPSRQSHLYLSSSVFQSTLSTIIFTSSELLNGINGIYRVKARLSLVHLPPW